MLALAGIVAALAVAPGHAEIAFESDGGIWSSRADGSERQLLVAAAGGERLFDPAWSPDGTTLAYVRTAEDEGTRVMVRDAAGTRALSTPPGDSSDTSPAWSPDGTALAFVRYLAVGERVFTQIVTQAKTASAERVVASVRLDGRQSAVGDPAWSPDGTRIAYTHSSLDRRSYLRHAVRTVAAAGGDSRLLLRRARSAVWSSDGARLAFASVRDRNGDDCADGKCAYAGELYTAAADGSSPRRLTRNVGDERVPAWAPDGSRILFTSDRNRPGGDADEIYSVAADGSCLTWVTNGTPESRAATWRPESGTRFDPGSCDPDARRPSVEPPAPKPLRDRLWLGPRHGSLLLSFVDDLPLGFRRTGYLAYNDCARFDPGRCGLPVHLRTEAACRLRAFSGLTGRGFRFVRRRGALVALSEDSAVVMSGHATTTVYYVLGRSLDRVLRRLRPLDAAEPPPRLEPPRIRRGLAPRLEATARAFARLGTVEETARARGISRVRARGHLRLRAALRSFGPYRFSSCEQ